MKLMSDETIGGYRRAFDEVIDLIQGNPTHHGFLKKFLKFWHPRRSHFSRSFKDPDAPATNLSEAFHSSYVNSKTTNLKLVEAAYRDVAYFVKITQAFALFPKGAKFSGTGPSQMHESNRNTARQNQRAKSYGEDINHQWDEALDENSKHRPKHPTRADFPSSSSEDELDQPSKKRRTNAKRSERLRTRSKKFLLTLKKAKSLRYTIVEERSLAGGGQEFQLRCYQQQDITFVTIGMKPSCNCGWYQKGVQGLNKVNYTLSPLFFL
jgi:hypothetical protein